MYVDDKMKHTHTHTQLATLVLPAVNLKIHWV